MARGPWATEREMEEEHVREQPEGSRSSQPGRVEVLAGERLGNALRVSQGVATRVVPRRPRTLWSQLQDLPSARSFLRVTRSE